MDCQGPGSIGASYLSHHNLLRLDTRDQVSLDRDGQSSVLGLLSSQANLEDRSGDSGSSAQRQTIGPACLEAYSDHCRQSSVTQHGALAGSLAAD
jgi:hypothetical protein